jgi:hypothetical protein
LAGGWFVLREEYRWLVAGGWFVLREKVLLAGGRFCSERKSTAGRWLADKPSGQVASGSQHKASASNSKQNSA